MSSYCLCDHTYEHEYITRVREPILFVCSDEYDNKYHYRRILIDPYCSIIRINSADNEKYKIESKEYVRYIHSDSDNR